MPGPTPAEAAALAGAEKRRFVRGVFDGIASRYDRMNLLISLGQTSWWRRRALGGLVLPPGARILDVGCGTGSVVRSLSDRHPDAAVEGMDLSPGMLAEARRRSPEHHWFEGDVTAIPREDATYDLVTTVYTLRNFPDLDASLAEMVRVLRPGGRVVVLDGFPPSGPAPWQAFHAMWLRRVMPTLVRPFADTAAYRYLAESILRHVSPEEVAAGLERHGAVVESVRRFGLGAAAAITARRS